MMLGQARALEMEQSMPAYLVDLLAWSAAFVILFFVFRYLQHRKSDKNKD